MTNALLTQKDVHAFLSARRHSSTFFASGVLLCIFSPIAFLVLISLTKLNILNWSINVAIGVGISILLIFVAIAVSLFIAGNYWLKINENYEYEECNLSEELRQKVIAEKNNYEKQHTIFKIIGISFCILSAIPFMSGALIVDSLTGNRMDDFMSGISGIALLFIGIGVFFLVKTMIIRDSFNIILQLKDYTIDKKAGKKTAEKYASIYWLTMALIYLGYSFISNDRKHSWIIWPLAGITYGICEAFITLKNKKAFSE